MRTLAQQRHINRAYAARFGPSPSRAIFLVLAIQQALDVLTTRWSERNIHAYEANPAVRAYIHLPLAVLLLAKVGLAAGGYLTWRWAEARHVRRTGRRPTPFVYLPLLALTGFYSYVLTSNLSICLQGGPL